MGGILHGGRIGIEEVWRTYREEGDEGEALARVVRRIAGRIGIEELPSTLIGTVYVSFAGALDYLRRTHEAASGALDGRG